ncbi:hypothetical protein E4U53_001274 [Claviceps sorghi]|nr:hypothetical protein E4U53_001274 [Claviceps sorghi]
MSRYIDRLPEPASRTPTKVIVATASRTGTMSVYRAMQILGFKAYHMAECIGGGVSQMQILDEAIHGEYNRFAGIQRYTKADFDKWFAEYDCIVEIPFFLGPELMKAYADDPNVKFILTDRNPDKWVTSFNNTVGEIVRFGHGFPVNILRHFDGPLYSLLGLNDSIYKSLADGTLPGEKNNETALRRNYVSYIDMAKRILPADRLCYFRLEDGLGWEQICPFLELPIPDQPFPAANVPEVFKEGLSSYLTPGVQRAVLKLGVVAAPLLGSLAYLGFKYSRLSR